ncbi:MAG: MBL fold metallo-hydrolase, partial [Alphaproteobacteria bacterium]
MMYNGVAFVTLVVDEDGGLAVLPRITAQGLFHPDEDEGENADVLATAAEAARVAFAALPAHARGDDEVIAEAIQAAVRRPLRLSRDKRPVVEVQIVRL